MKRTFALATACLAMLGAAAAPLTPEQALARLKESGQTPARVKGQQPERLIYTALGETGQPTVYVFGNDAGFMLAGADDAAAPLLGYSDAGRFDISKMPPQMKWWLEEYARQIEALSKADAAGSILPAEATVRPERPAISPMVATHWNQDAPYNDLCPIFEGRHSMTGCVATSMAQLMNYFKYPAIGTGSVKFVTERYQETLEMDFSERPFDWSNMLDSYNGDSPEDADAAVAYLMKACGYSVMMNYTPDESSTQSYLVAPALINNFQYDKGLYYANRNTYSPEEWEDLLYENLAKVGPVIYNGTSSIIGGHSFICDGYEGDGFFHINWGWGGTSDGWFLLDAMNPDTIGIGGGFGGFNFAQGAVIGAQPPVSGSVPHPANLTQQGTLEGTCKDNTLIFSLTGANPSYWINRGPEDIFFSMGAIFEPLDGTPGEETTKVCYLVGTSTSGSLAPTYYYKDIRPSVPVDFLADGRYKVTLAIKDNSDKESTWTPVLCDYRFNNYLYLTRQGEDFTIEVPPMRVLNATGVHVEGDLYLDCMATFTITVENPTEYELTQGFAPVIVYSNQNVMLGESLLLTVPAGETLTETLYTNLYALTSPPPSNSRVTVRLYNPSEGVTSLYPTARESVVLKKNPGLPAISVTDVQVEGTPDGEGVYELNTGEALDFEARLTVRSGYFAYPLYAVIYDADGTEALVQQRIGTNLGSMTAGQSATLNVSVLYPQAIEGEPYDIYLCYARNYTLQRIGNPIRFRVKGGAGIATASAAETGLRLEYDAAEGVVSACSDAAVEEISLYDAAGTLLARSPGDRLVTTGFPSGFAIAVARDASGATATLKTLLYR